MVTLRLHLDDADECNGALRVIPGSHLFGRLKTEQIEKLKASGNEVLCTVRKGDAVLIRPLLLHSSSRSAGKSCHRRVLHIDYTCFQLPGELRWNDGVC